MTNGNRLLFLTLTAAIRDLEVEAFRHGMDVAMHPERKPDTATVDSARDQVTAAIDALRQVVA